jgi:hypothetical protein
MPDFVVRIQGEGAAAPGQALPGGMIGRARTEKASLEGMSEAFGSLAEADDQ